MKALAASEIRRRFLDFFAQRGHEIVPSSSLVPADDPSLLFTNAGMVQFKRVFLGEESRSYTRAASSQKCVRAGGKHNDLDNVGYTARHHTFFEMLGNFSFGDYFKREAIAFAWEFLTAHLELPRERLWVTVFQDDDEAAALWREVAGVPADRIVRLGEKDNFWAMGDTGPCGPCSEILIDQGPGVGCGRPECRAGCDCDRYLELWNLVFMQFFRDEAGELHPLPRPSIDTGMGLERIAAVCQGKTTNFDSDLFAGLIARISGLSGRAYGAEPRDDVAMRVIADHARAGAFLVADGVLPSNEGRGYVLRRILRRAVRYGRVLGLEAPFLSEVTATVVDEMGEVYPELRAAGTFLDQVIRHEEARFAETLEFGLRLLDEEIDRLRRQGARIVPGDFIFRLYDTYGFPVDIVQDVCREEGLELDRSGFEAAMEAQRERSRRFQKSVVTRELPPIYRELLERGEGTAFVGYETLRHRARLSALVGADGAAVAAAEAGWEGELVAAETPFYGESGGQVGDRGWIRGPGGAAEVLDTRRRGDLVVHVVRVTEGRLATGEEVALEVLEARRLDTARNHTATHLLHAALRRVLGEHVKQAGSLVTPERLRFDFTHFAAVTPEELRRVEDLVNEQVRRDAEVETRVLAYREAVAEGAMALFGEKYGERVRVVSVPGWSRELCGGTHLRRTGEVGLFKILQEGSVASGVRRIEAVTGRAAVDRVHALEDLLSAAADRLRCAPREVPDRVERLAARVRELEKALEEGRGAAAAESVDDLLARAQDVNGARVLAARVRVPGAKALRDLGDRLRDRLGSGVVLLGAEAGGKALLLAMVTPDLTGRVRAGDLVKAAAGPVGGGGGGRPDMAQAGGPRPERLDEALAAGRHAVEAALGRG
ncbi:alanine--tRNA ligase [Dissulfurirhabdus thermomarina]|uniref:Alanine--tRNA ligase n=1 Tax=Dissulfurirhabdus thermomarina TaxID=1765737 RepID=A0A6N9TP71_DISTH|nr:alanine--tRNA ligase [Dissulfurirhabdus thermomarina]NDY43072.1 alanine--tRNA ligase [Dissulfurirhabdus thermomarina]NMX22385.1 alanine--tRNA ligase [Dissulfurirhabdus thermomarina]